MRSVELECVQCGRAFVRPAFQHEANLRRQRRGPFCSKSCGNIGREGKPLQFDAFWAKVDKTGDCWVWTGARDTHGYGHVRHQGQTLAAHRVAYDMTVGEIPAGRLLRHSCDNPPCVRPSHLLPGTYRDNALDREQRGRSYNAKRRDAADRLAGALS